MALPALLAVLGRAALSLGTRALAAGGRGAAALGRGAAARSGTRAGTRVAAQQGQQQTKTFLQRLFGRRDTTRGGNNNGPWNAQEATKLYGDAARHFGTPRPGAQQLTQYANHGGRDPADDEQQRTIEKYRRYAKGLAVFGASVYLARKAMQDYTETAVLNAQQLRVFSGAVAQTQSKEELRTLKLNVLRGQQTGGTTAAVLEARGLRQQAFAPLSNEMTNFSNNIVTAITTLQAGVGELINDIGLPVVLKRINTAIEWWMGIERDGKGGFQDEMRKFLRETSRGQFPSSPTVDEMRANQRKPRGK